MSERNIVDVDLTKVAVDLGTALGAIPSLVAYVARDRNTPKVLAAFDEAMAEWVIDLRRHTVAQLRLLESTAANAAETGRRLAELVEDPEFVRVQNNYGYEACREAINERRRMLAFASAGSVNLELSIAQLARVERTVRELDPTDILALQQVARIADPPRPARDDRMDYRNQLQPWHESCGRQAQTRFVILNEGGSLPVLSASGCVLVAVDTAGFSPKNSLTVTELGARVLRVLHAYLAAIGGEHG